MEERWRRDSDEPLAALVPHSLTVMYLTEILSGGSAGNPIATIRSMSL